MGDAMIVSLDPSSEVLAMSYTGVSTMWKMPRPSWVHSGSNETPAECVSWESTPRVRSKSQICRVGSSRVSAIHRPSGERRGSANWPVTGSAGCARPDRSTQAIRLSTFQSEAFR